VLEQSPTPTHDVQTETITIVGSKIVDSIGRETSFCRDGKQLRFRTLSDNPFGFVYTLERQ
jgi:hypothetical protein